MENINYYIKNTLNRTYDPGTNNHPEHNSNPLYWDLLLGDIKLNPNQFKNKIALDFGCGKGRNVTNMLSLAEFTRVDGVDISPTNIGHCRTSYPNQNSSFYLNSGADLADLNSDEYDFVMSTIVFQHICVHELRYNLKQEIYRVLKMGGIFSFQMGFGDIGFTGHTRPRSYYDNSYAAEGSNGSDDVRITDPTQLTSDLSKIGFKNITFEIHQPWEDGGHPNWIYIRCEK
jgi:SAM-dependent methyltransferase